MTLFLVKMYKHIYLQYPTREKNKYEENFLVFKI
jgi:hypothetical protein